MLAGFCMVMENLMENQWMTGARPMLENLLGSTENANLKKGRATVLPKKRKVVPLKCK